MITIRFRSRQGQINQQIDKNTTVIQLSRLVNKLFEIEPNNISKSLFNDSQYLKPLITLKKISTKTTVSELGVKHGSLIYVKLDNKNDENKDQNIGNTLLKNMQIYELDELINNPQLCPQCTHPQNIRCIKCINWWKEKCIQESSISQLEYDQWKLNKKAMEQQNKSYHKNVHDISEIKKQTTTQLYITDQKDEDSPIIHSALTQYAFKTLSDFLAKTQYQKEAECLLFGKIDENKQATIYFLIPLYFIDLFGTSVTQHDPFYEQIYNKIQYTIKCMFDWDMIGIASITKSRVFNSQQIIYAMKKHSRLFLHIQLCSHEYAQYREQQVKKIISAQKDNFNTQLFVQNSYNDQFTLSYVINNQLWFLYQNKQINKEQCTQSTFKFNTKQAINNQYMDEIETNLFMHPIKQPSLVTYKNTEIYVPYQDIFDIISQFNKDQVLDSQIVKNQRCKSDDPIFQRLITLIERNGINIIYDPMFIVYFMLCGGRCDDIQRIKEDVKDYLNR